MIARDDIDQHALELDRRLGEQHEEVDLLLVEVGAVQVQPDVADESLLQLPMPGYRAPAEPAAEEVRSRYRGGSCCTAQLLPSGSLNDAYAKYERPGKSGNPGGFGCSSTSLTSRTRATARCCVNAPRWSSAAERSRSTP